MLGQAAMRAQRLLERREIMVCARAGGSCLQEGRQYDIADAVGRQFRNEGAGLLTRRAPRRYSLRTQPSVMMSRTVRRLGKIGRGERAERAVMDDIRMR